MGNSQSSKHNTLQVPEFRFASGHCPSTSSQSDPPPAYSAHSESDRKSSHSRSPSRASSFAESATKKNYAGGTFSYDYRRKPVRQESLEDALDQLSNYDTVFIVDDSGSMREGEAGKTYWDEAELAMKELVAKAKDYDADGVDIYFLNSEVKAIGVKTTKEVENLFAKVEPERGTPIAYRLELLLLEYLAELEEQAKTKQHHTLKRVNYLIITDGKPSDEPEDVIVAAARRLEKGNFPLAQVGIQFVQVGRDKEAQKYLKDLDDVLVDKYKIRDMVDTVPFSGTLSGDKLVKILLGGINRQEDQKESLQPGHRSWRSLFH
ncbi:hypothetical protein C8J56DRAFT_151001 [Mycena floridula]|nr:hypothetical protein C8J56DRAFT_151001 [Mycena floridula]